jgi:hypothetical protein
MKLKPTPRGAHDPAPNPLLSSWENGMKQVQDADEFKEACS